ncbi:DNA polymerase IV [Salipaludibacillus keqinensis]|uniref:DNA polymerase IV n=2 Tax=Salipaludibacillus keqinensis TaxID=2045207 RepID=A0A323TEB8_9BACI|nr:DNA polymerase IV [Salipaludibacillus keqinensis]
MKKVIFLVDMQSFFASVEKAKHYHNLNRPLVVSGDPTRRSGVILAACPLAKKSGIQNGERLWEAEQKCPGLVTVPPHMQEYIDNSIVITEILESVTDLVEPYSIDEQFMDVTHSQKLFGDPYEIASYIQHEIHSKLRVFARVGIGENKVLAKMACDNFSKKNENGIFFLKKEELEDTLWPLPIEKLFRAGGKMSQHLRRRAIRTIGELARTDVNKIKKEWGIHGQVLWMNAHGVDYSPISLTSTNGQKAIGNGMTLPRDYSEKAEIKVVLLELCEEVCRRARLAQVMGQTVSLGVSGASYEIRTGFHRQQKMAEPTNMTMEVFRYACDLLESFWDREPIRRLHVSLSSLHSDQTIQLSLFEEQRGENIQLGYVTDELVKKYGKTAVIRAASLLPASQVKERSAKIGGHYK